MELADENKPKYNNGCIVAVNSHFYSLDTDTSKIYASGEPLHIPPLMVVVEALASKNSYEEETGFENSKKGQYQYKCTWFSLKTYQFEEAWFQERFLKEIRTNEDKNDFGIDDFSIGRIVELKTSNIELGKKKVSFKQKDDFTATSTIEALLSFVSPVMHIIGTKNNEPKEPIFNSKTNKKVRFISERLIKCRYYNPLSCKYSETLIPLKALSIIPNTEQKKIDELNDAIENKKYLLFTDTKEGLRLVNPIKLHYRSGRYYLKGYDYVISNNFKCDINNIVIIDIKDKFYKSLLPSFSESKGKLIVNSITDINIKKIHNKNDKFYIIYEDKNNSLTKRTIENIEFLTSDEKDDDDNNIIYLKADCKLRSDERYFRIDRIKSIYNLDLE